MHEKPNDKDTDIKIHVSTLDTTDIVHKKKRKIAKDRKGLCSESCTQHCMQCLHMVGEELKQMN